MNDGMRYRGPDGEGEYHDAHVAMGMRRLSIIDVGGSSQPLFSEDESLVLVANGEIYNYVELRQQLLAAGHRFATAGDCEVIVHLYEDRGEKCVDALRGMFAFILWDRKRRILFSARDRFGIKPLYLHIGDTGAVWLSSELKTIVSAAPFSPSIDETAVWQMLHYGYPIGQGRTALREVTRVLPGEWLRIDADGVRRHVYWHAPPRSGEVHEREDSELESILAESVSLHLRSDVSVGVLLSGGLDSSALAAYAASAGDNFTAYCVGFESADPRIDERKYARSTASALGIPYREIVLSTDTIGVELEHLIHYCDEPVADPSAAAQSMIYRAARQDGSTVILSGIGGDEIFFGYGSWNEVGEAAARDGRFSSTWTDHNPVYGNAGWMTRTLATPEFAAAGADAERELWEFMRGFTPGPDAVYRVLIGSYLLNNGLLLADKLGMAHSVEVRVPFADHVLAESVLTLPFEDRYQSSVTKPLLRRLMPSSVPGEVLTRPKHSFSTPLDFIRKLISTSPEVITGGYIAANLVDREALHSVTSDLLFGAIGSRKLGRGLTRRLWRISKQREQVALQFASGIATEFLYRVLWFERWWRGISDLASRRPTNAVFDVA